MKHLYIIRTFALMTVMALALTSMAQENLRDQLHVDSNSFTHSTNNKHARLMFTPKQHLIKQSQTATASADGTRLGSVVTEQYNSSKRLSIASTQSNPQSAYLIVRNDLGQLILNKRIIYTYDSLGRLLKSNILEINNSQSLLVDENLDPIGSIDDYEWLNSIQTEVTYTTDGKIITNIYEGENTNPCNRIVRGFDEVGREIFNEFWLWDEVKNELRCMERDIALYDDHDNILLRESYSVNNDQLVGTYKESATYDAQSNVLSQTSYNWNNELNSFVNEETTEYSYNSEGYYSSLLRKVWDGTAWQPIEKYDYSFSSVNKTLTAHLKQFHNGEWIIVDSGSITYLNSPQTPLRVETTKTLSLYTYDAANRNLSYHYYNKEEGAEELTLLSEEKYSYDAVGRITETWYKYYNTLETMGHRTQTSYTNSGYIQEEIYSDWNNSAWLPIQKMVLTYDDANRLTSYTQSKWDKEQEKYVDDYKNAQTYDTNGRLLTEISFFYNAEVNLFLTNKITKYVYDQASSIDNSSDSSTGSVYAISGTIVLDGFTGTSSCSVYSLDGIEVIKVDCKTLLANRVLLSVPQGVYIVRTENATYKVVVP